MKNGFLTFCFAFWPGAGQMYQGYMKRGLSLISLFCGGFVLGWLAEPLIVVTPIVWMYSFFDTFNLRAQLGAGTAPADDYLVHLGRDESLERLLARRHKLFGWVLVALGGYILYDEFVLGTLERLFWTYDVRNQMLRVLYELLRQVPQIILCLALILLGLWLVRGPRGAQGGSTGPAASAPEDIFAGEEDFCNYIAQEARDDHDDRTEEN